MIHQVAGFIRWQLEQDDGVNTMAGIISDANSRELMETLAEASENMNANNPFHRSHSMQSVIALDDHLTIAGLYKEMEEALEPGDECIAKHDEEDAYSSRWAL